MTVVVVGGGIVGMATAYSLAREGVDVVVCERGSVGAGSTERALGGIRAQFATPANVALSRRAMAVWADFEERFGVDIAYRRHGYLFVTADAETARSWEDTVEMQRARGVPSELLDPAEARRYLPELHADRYVAATYSPEDGTADPHLALQGFADAAREAGAEIRTGVAVTDVVFEGDDGDREEDGDEHVEGGDGDRVEDGESDRVEGGIGGRGGDGDSSDGGGSDRVGSGDGNADRVAGVETDEGWLAAEYVVNAAGPWAGEVAAMAGLSLPLSTKRRQIAVVEPSVPYPEDAPLTVDIDTGAHFAPDREGDAFVAGHFDAADPDHDPGRYPTDYDLDWVTTALEHVAHVAGYFGADTRVKNGWSGLYTVTPDHGPVIEESRPGFVNAVGFSGHGFMHAPATGQVVTDLVARGGTDVVDLAAFRSDRFDGAADGRETTAI